MEEENIWQLIISIENLPIIIDLNLERWYFNSYSLGYHACMNIWIPLTGDESLICRKEKRNEYDSHAVAITRNNIVVGHVPQNICDHFWKFLFLPKTSIRAGVLGKRVNRGAGYGLEIPVCFIFQGHVKGIAWVKKKIEDAEKMVQSRIEKWYTRCTIKDMYMFCIWYGKIIRIIKNKWKHPLYTGSFVSWGWKNCPL